MSKKRKEVEVFFNRKAYVDRLRSLSKEKRNEYEELKRASKGEFGEFERRQIKWLLTEDFVENFSLEVHLLELSELRDVQVRQEFTSMTAAMQSILALQAAAEQRLIRLDQYLPAHRVPVVVFSYCPPISFDLQTLHFSEFYRKRLRHIGSIFDLRQELEEYDESSLIRNDLAPICERVMRLVERWSDRTLQTAPLLGLLLPLHPSLVEHDGFFASRSPIISIT